MNEKVGEKLKKISKLEWTIGIILAVIEVIIYLIAFFAIKNTYMYSIQAQTGVPSSVYNLAVGIVVFPGMIITVLLTLYLFYKSKLMIYAYGYLTEEIHGMNGKLEKLEEKVVRTEPERVAPASEPIFTRVDPS